MQPLRCQIGRNPLEERQAHASQLRTVFTAVLWGGTFSVFTVDRSTKAGIYYARYIGSILGGIRSRKKASVRFCQTVKKPCHYGQVFVFTTRITLHCAATSAWISHVIYTEVALQNMWSITKIKQKSLMNENTTLYCCCCFYIVGNI